MKEETAKEVLLEYGIEEVLDRWVSDGIANELINEYVKKLKEREEYLLDENRGKSIDVKQLLKEKRLLIEENEGLKKELEIWKKAYHKLDPVGYIFNDPFKEK
jgi:hypothetical protein